MKFIALKIRNIGCIEDAVIPINKPLNLFYGEIRQGKTTVLNCCRWVLGGAYPADIIRHGADNADIRLEFEGGYIYRDFYLSAKTGEVLSHDLVFERDGKQVLQPVIELRKILNPFEKNQDYFRNMTGPERQRYFCELLGVDTGEIDEEAKDLKDQNESLNTKIEGFGTIDLTPIDRVDVIALRKQLTDRKATHAATVKKLQGEHAAKVAGWNTELAGLRDQWEGGKRKELKDAQAHQADTLDKHTALGEKIASLKEQLRVAEDQYYLLTAEVEASGKDVATLTAAVAALPDLKPQADALKAKIEAPLELPALNTADLDTKLQDAAANAVRYERYLENVGKAEQRKTFNDLLDLNKERLKELRLLKAQKLAEIAEASGIPKLSFDEDGNFVYEDTAADLLSTSQSMILSKYLESMYPEGFGLSLLDRSESLGDSIFKFIDAAKNGNKTILASIVGERPANVPENVGVFVVSEGKVSNG